MAFAAGSIAILVALGTSLGAVSEALTAQAAWLRWIGGALIIAFGLIALRLLRVPALELGFGLDSERRSPNGCAIWGCSW